MEKPMSKNIHDYLPNKTKRTTLIQARVPADIALEVKKMMARNNLRWSEVLTACMRHLIDEHKKKES